jgi:hypothetical protein
MLDIDDTHIPDEAFYSIKALYLRQRQVNLTSALQKGKGRNITSSHGTHQDRHGKDCVFDGLFVLASCYLFFELCDLPVM